MRPRALFRSAHPLTTGSGPDAALIDFVADFVLSFFNTFLQDFTKYGQTTPPHGQGTGKMFQQQLFFTGRPFEFGDLKS
jgi:alpha/beta superfamily hydrolase